MFKVVKKLRGLKRHMKKIAWKDGNVFDRVKQLKEKLKEIQVLIVKEPDKKEYRVEESLILKDYANAANDEEKLLFQRAKIKWISDGDRNNAFFHKNQKSRIIRVD